MPGRYSGIVERELRGRGIYVVLHLLFQGHHSEAYGGKISFTNPDTKVVEALPFDAEDVDKRFVLKRGDKVEFRYLLLLFHDSYFYSIATNRRNKEKKASSIVLMRETGVVEGIKQSYGFIQCDEKAHAEEKLFFHEREVWITYLFM